MGKKKLKEKWPFKPCIDSGYWPYSIAKGRLNGHSKIRNELRKSLKKLSEKGITLK